MLAWPRLRARCGCAPLPYDDDDASFNTHFFRAERQQSMVDAGTPVRNGWYFHFVGDLGKDYSYPISAAYNDHSDRSVDQMLLVALAHRRLPV